MAQDKAPAFQFYAKEFLADAKQAGMSLQEAGAYIRLMCVEWNEAGKGIPDAAVKCARMVGATDAHMKLMWAALRACFQPHPDTAGQLIHPRLEKERQKQLAYRRRQSDKGKASANRRATERQPDTQPEGNHGSTGGQPEVNSPISDLRSPNKEQEREKNASLSPAALFDPHRDPFTDPVVTERAGRFVERYTDLYQVHRKGARYAVKPTRDYAAAVTLCRTWTDDARLEKLAIIFLTTDHRFAEEGSRTIPQFLAIASWCDGRLAEHEAKRAS